MSNIFIVILSTLTVSFAIAYSVTLYRITKINQAFTKLLLSHESLQEFIAKNNVEFKNDSDIHKENFIKFSLCMSLSFLNSTLFFEIKS